MKNVVYIVVALVVVVGGYFAYTNFSGNKTSMPDNSQNMTVPEDTTSPSEDNVMTSDKAITLDEISKHASPSDCWFAISGKVYDVTSFVASGKHPGGDKIIKGCGRDATVLFNTKDGEGEEHSDKANENLANFLIGTLVK